MANNLQNSSTQELKKFNFQAGNWWDTEGAFKALHKINPLRLEFINQHQNLTNKKVLDVGCGGGILSESLVEQGAKVIGIDLATEVLSVAKLHGLESGLKVEYKLESIEEHSKLNPKAYDCITCMEMLEHVPDIDSIIQSISTAIKPEGWVFFSTLNKNYKSYLLAILVAENILDIVPKGTHKYENFIKPSELDSIARKYGLKLKNSAGIDFNPIINRYRLNNNLSVNYLLAYQKTT